MIRTWINLLALTICLLIAAGCGGNEMATPTPEPAEPISTTETPAPQIPATETIVPDTPAEAEPAAEAEDAAPDTDEFTFAGFVLENVGFETPESVLYDPVGDVYLVANINGSPSAADGNGFISRLSPVGDNLILKWIDGMEEGVTLNAPKGMAITGEELWVADITSVRIFERTTGRPIGDVPVAGASFLNDVAAAPDGSIWVSDSNTGKLHRIAPDRSVAEIATIDGINGVAFQGETPLVTSGTSIFAVNADGSTSEAASVPTGGLDGLVVLFDGRLAVSSWNGSTVYLLADGNPMALIGDVNSPADIGYDAIRGYILIPLFRDNMIQTILVP